MELVSTYYPYVLYAIPYVIAAYVLIRARLKERQSRRDAARLAERQIPDIDMDAEAANDDFRAPPRRVTRMMQRVADRPLP